MYISRRIWTNRVFFFAICISVFLHQGQAQQPAQNVMTLPSDLNNNSTTLPLFFEKEKPVGSAYLSKFWMRGIVELTNHSSIPTPDQNLYFNFDKLTNILYVLDNFKRIYSFPIDSVVSFELAGIDKLYSFEKVAWISNSFYLMPVIKSAKGYSLYKRLYTKVIQADYTNQGYTTTGKKFDEFADYYEYYMVYPGNTVFRKMYLKENTIRRALKNESQLLDEFFSLHDNEINEQSLLGIIQYINDKKYPD